MTINYWAILVCAILSMVIGGIWYGPLFGKKWMEIVGVKPEDLKARERMQKSAGLLYALQFVLSLFQVWVLAYYIEGWKEASGIENALWIWAAFVMPTIAAASMWNNDSAKISWTRFALQAGYQLIMFAIFGLILSLWK